jgi:hypothetical protein
MDYGGKEVKPGAFGGEDYDWMTLMTRRDPITNRDICYCCWFGDHDEDGCKIRGCKCLCTELKSDMISARVSKGQRTRVRKKALKEALVDSPLKADNPNAPEPRRKDVG